ncbi:hypothetical protein K445DRAFT_23000 [Daldinia sp. EC12]|nr:hypothetical protein K445DRAFT_23000 [Daldinia sp. EC12]
MKSFHLATALATAGLLPATQATWCQLFYDDACTNSANGDTNFDCYNFDVFGSGGGFIQCHSTPNNNQQCLVHRCDDASCEGFSAYVVDADRSCINMKGAGPYYQLFLV